MSAWRPSWLHSYSRRGLEFMLAIGTGDTWDGHSLRLSLLSGPHCPLCGDISTWAGRAWPHFFTACTGSRAILSQPPAIDWILHLSTSVSPGFALFSAATTFADAAGRLLGYISDHGDISSAGRGERLLPDDLVGPSLWTLSSPPSIDGSMATIVCCRQEMDTASSTSEEGDRTCTG